MSDDPMEENDQTSWRDILPELSEVQIGALEHMEAIGMQPDSILDKAREFASGNLLGSLFEAVKPPPGAGRWLDFQGTTDDHTAWLREFFGREVDYSGLKACISGKQRSDGAVAEAGLLISGQATLTSEQCRELASALMARANEIDGLLADGD